MITAITIENFKGIGAPCRIPIKPLTLLFGPNSGGKSTILQAIHYAAEVLERRNLDAHQTVSGGKFVELGGFSRMVHQRDTGRAIKLRFDFNLNWSRVDELPKFRSDLMENDEGRKLSHSMTLPKTAAVEFAVCLGNQGLYVSEYSVHLDGLWFGSIHCDAIAPPSGNQPIPIKFNFEHPIIQELHPKICDYELKHGLEGETLVGQESNERNLWQRVYQGDFPLEVDLEAGQPLALPDFRSGFGLYYRGGHGDNFQIGYHLLDGLFSLLMIGPGQSLIRELKTLRYIGPLRDVPAPNYLPPSRVDDSRWVGGLAAWDVLHLCDNATFDLASEWMSSADRLDLGYELKRQQFREIGSDSETMQALIHAKMPDHLQKARRELISIPERKRVTLLKAGSEGEVLPHEVGTGVSQILPIVVACVLPDTTLLSIEQPELHLHPRLQCELGDLLIYGAMGHFRELSGFGGPPSREQVARSVIIETHSEHLILRILRRIRETTLGRPHNGIALTPDDLSVCYISQKDGQSVICTMSVDDQGEFIEPWPDRFFEYDFYERIG